MKPIKCMLGMHSYSQASAEVNVTDIRHGYLICRVRNCCINCGTAFEDIVPIPFPEWLSIDRAKMDGERKNDEQHTD